MNLADIQHKIESSVHEVQVGTFRVIGKFPVLVLAHLKEIFQKSGRPLFIGSRHGSLGSLGSLGSHEIHGIQVLLDDSSDRINDGDPFFQNKTLILDPFNDSHKRIADEYRGTISWYCVRNLPQSNYRGTYFNSMNREVIYAHGDTTESYVLDDSMQITRELSAALCAAREAGIQPDEIRRALYLKSRSPRLKTIQNSTLAK